MSNVIELKNIKVAYPLPNIRYSTFKEFVMLKLKKQLKTTSIVVYDDVNLSIEKGEFVSIVGANGSGKSTLLRVIAGILTPNKGTVEVNGRMAPLIELGAGFDPELTGRENVFLSCSLMGLSFSEIRRILPAVKDYSELGESFEYPVKTYSSGMYTRLGFSCAVYVDAPILLIDEILAVGDEVFQKKCMNTMLEKKKKGITFVFVSHDLSAVEKLSSRVVVLHKSKKIFDGGVKEGIDAYHSALYDTPQ